MQYLYGVNDIIDIPVSVESVFGLKFFAFLVVIIIPGPCGKGS